MSFTDHITIYFPINLQLDSINRLAQYLILL